MGAAVTALLAAGAPLDVNAESLDEALAAAYNSNPSLRAARSELRSVNEQVPQALSGWRPTVTVTGEGGARHVDTNVRGAPDPKDRNLSPLSAELRVTQNLYRGGRTVAETEQARANVQAQRARLLAAEQDVLFRAVTAYMNVWRDEAVLRLNQNNEQVLERQLEASQDRFEVGEITLTDVAQSESRLALATANRIRAEGELQVSRADYEEVIGKPPTGVEPPPSVGGLPLSQDDAIAEALGNNPNVVAADFAERAAQAQVRAREGELLPTVSVSGALGVDDEVAGEDTSREVAEVIAGVTIPLYQSGAEYSRVRQAKQTASQRRLELDQQRRSAAQTTITAWEVLQTSLAQITSFRSQVSSAEVALEGVRQENTVGARTILDILDAEQELLDAQVNLVGAQRDETVASYGLLLAVGRLTAGDLALPVEIYDPQRDYDAVEGSWFGLTAPGAE